MTEAVATIDSIRTLADLVERLGGVPIDRIRFRPAPGTATVEDVERIHRLEGRLCELVDGTLLEKPMGFPESVLAGCILTILNNFVKPRKLGMVAGADGILKLMPDLIRIPDVAFVTWEKFRRSQDANRPIPLLAPNLAVEVLSSSNTVGEMAAKRNDYFAAGVDLVWEVDPVSRCILVYSAPSDFSRIEADGELTGGDLLPGFATKLADVFEVYDQMQSGG